MLIFIGSVDITWQQKQLQKEIGVDQKHMGNSSGWETSVQYIENAFHFAGISASIGICVEIS